MSDQKRDLEETADAASPLPSRSPRLVRVQHLPAGSGRLHMDRCSSLFSQCVEALNESFHSWYDDFVDSAEYREMIARKESVSLLLHPVADYNRICDSYRKLYAQEPGRVLMFGSNEMNELGHREEGLVHKRSGKFPRPVTHVKNIVSFSAGSGQHNLASQQDGTAWSWGANDYGQLGRDTSGDDDGNMARERLPNRITGFWAPDGSKDDDSIIKVAAGTTNSLFLSIHGRVYHTGTFLDDENNKWCFPTSSDDTCQGTNPVPVYIPLPGKVKDIRSGAVHCLFLLEDGSLYSLGIPRGGTKNESQGSPMCRRIDVDFGDKLNRKESYFSPRPVEWPPSMPKQKVLSFACGTLFTLVASRPFGSPESFVYGCGLNEAGQLGLGHLNDRVYVLTMVRICFVFNSSFVFESISHLLRTHLPDLTPNAGRILQRQKHCGGQGRRGSLFGG